VQWLADPFDVIPVGKPRTRGDDAQRNLLAGLAQPQVVHRAIGESRLGRDDRGMVERIYARMLQLDVQFAAAGECGRGSREQDQRGCAQEEFRGHGQGQ